MRWVTGTKPLQVHTAAGKKAISRFAAQCDQVRRILDRHVASAERLNVAWMAAFYADAVPISVRFEWSQSRELEALGFEADMCGAGCPKEVASPVLNAVLRNLHQLNECRLEALAARSR